jgi:predicted MPP superfamily phosphohydrolase
MWRLNVTRYRITPANWPRGLKLSIGVIADVHAGGPVMPAERIAAIAQSTNMLAPDMVVLLGDFAASHKFKTRSVAPEAWSEALGELKAPLGVHAILGNHDWWDDPEAVMRGRGPVRAQRALEAVGIPVYENDARRLHKDGRAFWLAGLGDQWALGGRRRSAQRRAQPRRGVDDLPATMAQMTDDTPVLLMAHEPDIFPSVPSRVALTFAGHTHGGQIALAGLPALVPSRYGRRYAYGHIVEDGRHLIVSGGLGCSGVPLRFGVPPEIVLVELGGGHG